MTTYTDCTAVLREPLTHIVLGAQQQARVVPTTGSSVLCQGGVDVDVGEHTVPVRVIGSDAPAITEGLALGSIPVVPPAETEKDGSSSLVESIAHLAILFEGIRLVAWGVAAILFQVI
jgi:hypothetical protein